MAGIRAFVGHSFTEDDAEVVRKFLEYFDLLSKLDLDFSWEHAEAAEPKLLADKVLALLDDKNVFVGICTKKERVIQPSLLRKNLLRPNVLRANGNDFLWKTSDWIIQEIGLAIGKGLAPILLMESGVRQPGGLQGDVEYIQFERDAPEKSFGKIVEMINALTPRASNSLTKSSGAVSVSEEEKADEVPDVDLWNTPQADWKRNDYEFAFFRLIISEDIEAAANIDQSYLSTEDGLHDEQKASWKAYTELTKLRWGKGGSLENLVTLAEEYSEIAKTSEYLAQAFENFEQYAKAASSYEAAASKSTENSERLRLLGHAAEDYLRADSREASANIISQLKTLGENTDNSEIQILRVLKTVAALEKDDDLSLGIMERIVEIDPSDTDARFALAYKYSDDDNYQLALLHYLKISHQERNSATWNNLGVAFERNSLPTKAVNAYREAAKKDETLAMSNLALRFMSAGFVSEAQKECETALAIEGYDENVPRTLARLRGLPGEENEKQSTLLDKAKQKSDFYKEFGRAACQPNLCELAGRWDGPHCVLTTALSGETFAAVGSYKKSQSGLATIGRLGSSTSSVNVSVVFRVEYKGVVSGRAIKANLTRGPENEKPQRATLLGGGADLTKVLMFLTDDDRELKVMEHPSGGNPKFYSIKCRITND